MTKKLLKRCGVLTSVCLALPYASVMHAATIDASLGVPAASVGFFVIDCPAGTHHLSGHITDRAPVRTPDLTLTMIKGVVKNETTDPIDGLEAQANPPLMGEFPSPTVHVNLGAGKYYLLVEKDAAGTDSYRMFVECRDAFENPLAPLSGPSPAP
jgi:hypothetical protein